MILKLTASRGPGSQSRNLKNPELKFIAVNKMSDFGLVPLFKWRISRKTGQATPGRGLGPS